MKTKTLTCKFVDKLPDHVLVEEGILYVLSSLCSSTHLCPCGCKTEIHLPLTQIRRDDNCPKTQPRWDFVHHEGSPTIHPSVLTNLPCKSHYFITKGNIDWC